MPERGTTMPIDIPFENHGRYLVALVALKGHPNRVYHFSKTAGEEESWCIRDYFLMEMVRSGESTMTASQIEELVEYAEAPVYRSIAAIPRWKADCQAAAERRFGAAHVDSTTRNPPTLGKWRRMNKKAS